MIRDADPLAFELAQLAILLALGRELAAWPESPGLSEGEPVRLAPPAAGQSLP